MDIQVRKSKFQEISPLRECYRREANCQIVRDSILGRGLADPYLVLVDGAVAGYAGVWNEHFKLRLMEFHTLPEYRGSASSMFRVVLETSRATHIEAQTNMPLMTSMLYECSANTAEENILFEDGPGTNLNCPGAVFRPRKSDDRGPEGDWAVELNGEVVAAGSVLNHYNPPYGDIYLEVIPETRRRGIGSYIVQELRRVCHENGMRPAARCDPDNVASRRALTNGGLVECGRLLAGRVNV